MAETCKILNKIYDQDAVSSFTPYSNSIIRAKTQISVSKKKGNSIISFIHLG